MFRPPLLLSLLAPVGAVWILLFNSLGADPWLAEFGRLLDPEYSAGFPSKHAVGGIGWLLVGLGVLNSALIREPAAASAKVVRLLAAVAFLIAGVSIGVGAWRLNASFTLLATAAVMEPAVFQQGVATAKLWLMFGWSCVVGGAILMFVADYLSMATRSAATRFSFLSLSSFVAACCCLIFLLAGFWSEISTLQLTNAVAQPAIEPARLEGGAIGLIRSELLTAIGIFAGGCALGLSGGPSVSNIVSVQRNDDAVEMSGSPSATENC